jgi:uncharacterized membrane protein YkvI
MSSKKGKEARAERITWFAMVVVFMMLSFDRNISIPDYVIPFIIAGILFVSGFYQYTKQWRVSPIMWIVGAVLTIAGIFGIYYNSPIDLRLVSLVAVLIVIGLGVLTNES